MLRKKIFEFIIQIESEIKRVYIKKKRNYEFGYWERIWHTEEWMTKERDVSKRYTFYFGIDKEYFANKIILDIGCGPLGSLDLFNAKMKIGLDPLAAKYFNFGIKKHHMIYIAGLSERLPFSNNLFDAVVSVNSLDHIDNLKKTVSEIHRVLKKHGEILFEINYQNRATIIEPIILRDGIIKKLFLNRFNYKIIKRLEPDDVHNYQRIVIKGIKI